MPFALTSWGIGGLKGLGAYQTIGADGQMLYLDKAGLTDGQTIAAIQAWLAPSQLAPFLARVKAGLTQIDAQSMFDNALTCTRKGWWANLDGTCQVPDTSCINGPCTPQIVNPSVHVSTPSNYASGSAPNPTVTTQQISYSQVTALPPTIQQVNPPAGLVAATPGANVPTTNVPTTVNATQNTSTGAGSDAQYTTTPAPAPITSNSTITDMLGGNWLDGLSDWEIGLGIGGIALVSYLMFKGGR